MEIIKPKLDVVFKTLFTKNIDLLKCFVADILEIPESSITNLDIEDPRVLPNEVAGKQSQLDLVLSFDDKIVNVEIQLSNKGDFPERSLYYWANLYSGDLKVAEKYSRLRRAICINIVDFILFNDCNIPYSEFLVLEKNRHILLTDRLAILFLELPKINSEIDRNDHKKLWMQFLKVETEEELNMLRDTNVPEIQKAADCLHKMNADDEMRSLARLREKAMYDERSAIDFAKRKGRKEEREETIAKMREKGYTEEQIRDLYS